MDQAMVDWAITAMDFGDDTVRAEQWFKLLTAAYHDPDEGEPVAGWDEFVAGLYPAAEREGFDSAEVQLFAESLRDSSSDPIGDVVLPLYEQRDTLPQDYLELRAARADGPAEYDGGHGVHESAESADHSPESEWHWDDSKQIWHHLEGGEWVPQVQNGHALNYERTEWVIQDTKAVDAEPPDEQPHDLAALVDQDDELKAQLAWEAGLSNLQAAVMENDALAQAIAELEEGELAEIIESLFAEQQS